MPCLGGALSQFIWFFSARFWNFVGVAKCTCKCTFVAEWRLLTYAHEYKDKSAKLLQMWREILARFGHENTDAQLYKKKTLMNEAQCLKLST